MNRTFFIIAGIGIALPALAVLAAEPTTGPTGGAQPAADAATESAAPATAQKAQSLASGTVARATFTKAVADHEPVDSIDKLTANDSKVYYFTELRDMAGQTVTHRWEYNGKVMAEVPFTINGSRWRVFSSKNLQDAWLGEWKVSVIDQAGGTIAVNTFTYEKPAPAMEAPADTGADTMPAAEMAAPADTKAGQ